MEYPIHTIETHSDDRWWAGPQIYDGKTLADMREIAKGILADRAKTDSVRIFGIFNKKRTLLDEVRRSAEDDGKGVAEKPNKPTEGKAGMEYPLYVIETYADGRWWSYNESFVGKTLDDMRQIAKGILADSDRKQSVRIFGVFNGKRTLCDEVYRDSPLPKGEHYQLWYKNAHTKLWLMLGKDFIQHTMREMQDAALGLLKSNNNHEAVRIYRIDGGKKVLCEEFVRNSTQIDNTDYYRLPCGRYLEDYIEYKQYSFAFGSCMKYEWRKGKKDGESEAKDAKKTGHYIRFIASARGYDEETVRILLDNALEGARKWDGKIETPTVGSKYWKGGTSDAFI